MAKNKGGRPTKMTPETIKKLEEAFLMGCSDLEACLYADITHQTLYTYQKGNDEFLERKKKLKENPVMIARKTVLQGIEKDSKLAFDYLKAKKSDEFAEKKNIGITDKEGNDMKWQVEIIPAKTEKE